MPVIIEAISRGLYYLQSSKKIDSSNRCIKRPQKSVTHVTALLRVHVYKRAYMSVTAHVMYALDGIAVLHYYTGISFPSQPPIREWEYLLVIIQTVRLLTNEYELDKK
jgi:hypothetical protein